MEFSEEEQTKIMDAFKALGVKPKADSPQDLQTWMLEHLQAAGKVKSEDEEEDDDDDDDDDAEPEKVNRTATSNSQWPRLSTFSGDETSKTDVSFDLWKYEVSCLLEEKLHPEESIRQAIRRSLRGQAARVAKNMGLRADSKTIVKKLEAVFGTVEVGQTLLSEFYAARQRKGEGVASWGCRLEDMVNRMQDQGLIAERDVNEMLRTQFWTQLFNQRLKDSSRHKYDSINNFDKLRREIRVIEREYKLTETKDEEETSKAKKTQVYRATTSTTETADDTDGFKELRGMVHKLTNQMESMQQHMKNLGQGQPPVHQPFPPQPTQPFPPQPTQPHPQQMPGPRQQGPRPGQQMGPGPGQPAMGFQGNPQATPPQDVRQNQFYNRQQGQQYHPQGQTGYNYNNSYNNTRYPSPTQNMVGNGCFKCGVVGHYKSNCPMKYEMVVCYYCHQSGHVKRDCPYQQLNSGYLLSRGGQ